MKSGLGKASLPFVKVTFAGKKALTEQSLGSLKNEALHKILMLSYQNIFD
jgi:hypothetical protein